MIIILYYFIFIVLKTREDTSKTLQEICHEIYTQKLEFNNLIAERTENDNRKFKLVSDLDFLGIERVFVRSFFLYLWDDPKIVSKLLINSNIEDVKSNLAPFFVNNFYENILSSVYMEDNLMYLISLILIEEIKGLRKERYNKFLEETVSGYILEQLKNKIDVKNYFKTIIYSLLEKLEAISSFKQINLNVKQKQEELNQAKEFMQKNIRKSGLKQKIINKNFYNKNANFEANFYDMLNESKKDNKQKDLFNSKYIPDVTKKELQNKIKENEGNKGMEEYCNIQIKNLENNSNIFSNEKFLANILLINDSSEVLTLYQIDFFKVIEIIDELFNNLIDNINLIPYSVKCICKIILSLVKKGNPNINTIEQNILLSRFFFNKLFLPIFRNPGYEALINNFIISDITIHNLDIISKVIEKLISGSFINNENDNCDYTPFNFYFLEKMPMVLKFLENITKVTLPPLIDKLINGNLPNDFKFNYFIENPEEVFFHRSICFNMDVLLVLLSNMKKCENKLFNNENSKLKKVFCKLKNEEILNSLKEHEIIINEKQKKEKKIINYYLLTDLLVNDKYKKLFDSKQERPNFIITELKQIKNEKDKQRNNIIRAKNFLSCLLYNYRSLIKTDFEEGSIQNTIKILNELKKFKKISNDDIDEIIPFEWYINSLIDIINYLPTDLQLNDFENLFKSLEIDVSNSIIIFKDINLEIMSIYMGKVKFSKRIKIFYENAKKSIIDLELNKKVKFIVEKEPISSIISMKYTEKEKQFKIEKGKAYKEIPVFEIFKDDNENKKICPTIESFVNKFPDISKIQRLEDLDLFELESKLNIPDELSKYFKIVKEYLTKQLNIFEYSKEFEYINNKIFDYVFENIYDKIYPQKPNEKDNDIYKKCILLSDVEPKHIIEGENNNFIFDSLLRDVFGYFEKIEKEKSPRKKFFNISQIFDSVYNVFKLNGNIKEIGADDVGPILQYALIKSHPLHIYTNYQFINLFSYSKIINSKEDFQLIQLEGTCRLVEDCDYNQYINRKGI